MGSSAEEIKTSIDWDSDDGMVHISTRDKNVMPVLAKHPLAQLVEVEVNQDCKVTSGEWELPSECFRIVLTGGGSEFAMQYASDTPGRKQKAKKPGALDRMINIKLA